MLMRYQKKKRSTTSKPISSSTRDLNADRRLRRGLIKFACATLSLSSWSSVASASSDSVVDAFRRTIVQSAQVADKLDLAWQQLAGEVSPPWERTQIPPSAPPKMLNEGFASEVLDIPLEVAAACSGVSIESLVSQLPEARRTAILFNPVVSDNAMPGIVEREFSKEFSQAETLDISNSTVFNFEMYVRWRVIQKVCFEDVLEDDRTKIRRCFFERLGDRLLDGPLRVASTSSETQLGANATVRQLDQSLSAVLDLMQQKGMFAKYSIESASDVIDEDDLVSGSDFSWQCVVSASVLAGGSQLARDRYIASGKGIGYYPGQLLTAPLGSCARRAGITVLAEEYFLDNRVGLPDPRTYSDKRYYSDTLITLQVEKR